MKPFKKLREEKSSDEDDKKGKQICHGFSIEDSMEKEKEE
jgi:hypothetical protein